MFDGELSRRSFLAGALSLSALPLAACSSGSSRRLDYGGLSPAYARMYAAMPYEKYPIPAVNPRLLKPDFVRVQVVDPTGEKPGTIVVDTSARYLYLVGEGGTATRYGIGVGREGFRWSGRAVVGRKAEWPTWTPTPGILEREPEARQYASGMPGGLNNPLGARALYIYKGGRDTLYRLHGTPEVWSIGQAVSSGCVRLINQDVVDLYERCPVGTPIVVHA